MGIFPKQWDDLSRKLGYPIIADVLSGLRFGNPNVVGSYDTFLQSESLRWDSPECVIRFGQVPTSKALNTYLDSITPTHRIHVNSSGEWADDSHHTTHFIQVDEALLCQTLAHLLTSNQQTSSSWENQIRDTETMTWQAIDRALATDDYFDGAALVDVVDGLLPGSTLVAGNSLPVRHLDQFARPTEKYIYVHANRGASGIDGNISTALGVGAARRDHPLVLVIGDVAFYHDLNGLLAVKRCDVPITIVLLNNNGGGIFYRLPIREFDPVFTDLFVTPHGIEFEPVVRMYGLDYVRAHDHDTFQREFSKCLIKQQCEGVSCVIEVRTDAKHDLKRNKEVISAVQDALR